MGNVIDALIGLLSVGKRRRIWVLRKIISGMSGNL